MTGNNQWKSHHYKTPDPAAKRNPGKQRIND